MKNSRQAERLGSLFSGAIQRAATSTGRGPVGVNEVQRYIEMPFVQRALPVAAEALEVALTATIVAQEQHAITRGGLHYESMKASRFGNPPQPYDQEYSAVVLAIEYTHSIRPNLRAVFRVFWQGNEYGEIGAAYVRIDIDHTEFWKSSLDVKFTALENMPKKGQDPRLWPIKWTYEGDFDPAGAGEWEFQGIFEIDAGGGFYSIEHKVVDRTTWWGIGGDSDPYAVVKPGRGKYSVIPIKPTPLHKKH